MTRRFQRFAGVECDWQVLSKLPFVARETAGKCRVLSRLCERLHSALHLGMCERRGATDDEGGAGR